MISDSFRVRLQTFGQVGSLREERRTDSGEQGVILTFMDVLILHYWFATIRINVYDKIFTQCESPCFERSVQVSGRYTNKCKN